MMNISNRTKTLNFGRANFRVLRAQPILFPGKGACECWELLKNSYLEAQEQSIPYEVKGRKQNKRLPWLNNEVLDVLKSKKDAY